MFIPRLLRDKKPVEGYGFSNMRSSEETFDNDVTSKDSLKRSVRRNWLHSGSKKHTVSSR